MSTLDAPPVLHPLEPLTRRGDQRRVGDPEGARRASRPTARFVFITPARAAQGGRAGGRARRRARRSSCSTRGPSARPTRPSSRSTDRSVVSWRHIEGVQPPIMVEEFMACEEVVQADPRWQAAMRKRGVEDFSLAMIDPWAAGYTGPRTTRPSERRILRPLTWVRSEPGEHGYARPVEGLIVDVRPRRDGGRRGRRPRRRPAAAQGRQLRPGADGRRRTTSRASRRRASDLKPIEITQPEGPSFTVDGHDVRWQKWQLRVGFTPREGLVLHEIGYEDRGTLRPIIYRASLAEMYVPYGDPAPTHRFKNVFDQGEYGVGWLANPLDARLRLPGRDPLLRRRRQRPGRRADGDPERHLHARGGRRDRLEAHGLPHRGGRGAAAAAAGDLDASPPSATTSTGTSGTSTPTARSSTRSSSPA